MSTFGSTPLVELRKKLDDAQTRYSVAVAAIQPLQDEINYLREAIHKSLSGTATKLFSESGKSAGDITISVDGAGKFKASIGKTVRWDSSKLQSIAAGMSWSEASSIFKIDFSVPEVNFKAAKSMNPALAEKLIEARTVKYGDLKIVPIE